MSSKNGTTDSPLIEIAEENLIDKMQAAAELEGPITRFFDNVFVMDEDERVRSNRLALLKELAGVTKGIIDLTALPGF